ncbi:MAG TPA: acetyl-CoA carboxylase biotin carboxyl carrier protein subunit, partial [Dehalococcoidia bacterium]|nr:acetyl-CoA carboxylase biotin carboxyl carrier protein subunit [Dehalococcoidia bacterium]
GGRTTQRISTDEILCSVPGVVLTVDVADGDPVVEGQTLLVIESMKTEQVVKSPRDGTVQRVAVQPGDRVDRGMRLVALAPLEKT